MNKERILYIAALAAMFIGGFCVYHFYFAAKLERYAKHQKLLESMLASETKLKATFGAAVPDDVIRDHNGKVEAWNEAIAVRIPFFNDADWRVHEKPPEDVFILQFWYGDETRKMVTALGEKAQKEYGAQVVQRMPEGFPYSVQAMLGVAYSQAWQGKNIDAKLVNKELEQLSFGISALELLMDNKAKQISKVGIEKVGTSGFIGKGVDYVRVSLSFMMETKDLVDFLEKLRLGDSFYSVQGMRVSHPYILAKYEPLLQVDMYLLRTRAEEGFSGGLGGGGSASAGYESRFGAAAAPGSRGNALDHARESRRAPKEEMGGAARAWKWFKRNVLYTN